MRRFFLRCLVIATTLISAAHLAPAAWAAGADAASSPSASGLAGAAGLKAQHQALQDQLQNNQFNRPIVLNSTEASGSVKGDIYAVLDSPFAQVNSALGSPDHWCDILILHLNTKYCRMSNEDGKTMLRMHVGKKIEQDLDDTYRIDFNYLGGASNNDYLSSSMQAAKGPLDTSNYRILIEAIPLDEGHSFLHLSYSYSFGMASKLAVRAYLATVGRDKVGFTVTDRKPNGELVYVQGTRATVERNTMRYYLAIEAYLKSQAAPAGQRLDKRLDEWFATTEQYRPQLHEVDKQAYLTMKRNEVARQQKAAE